MDSRVKRAFDILGMAAVAHAAFIDSPGPNPPTDADFDRAKFLANQVAQASLAFCRAVIAAAREQETRRG